MAVPGNGQPHGASAGQIRAMVAGLNAVVWERDPLTFGVRFVNERIEEVLGHSVPAWLDDPELWQRSLHPDDRDRIMPAIRGAVADAGDDFSLTYRALAADGRVVWLHHLGHVARDDDGRPTALHAVLIDVTAQKRREHSAALLAEAGLLLTEPGPVERRLAALAGLVLGDLGQRVTVWLRGDDGRFRAVAAAPEESTARAVALGPVAAPPELEEIYRRGRPHVVPHIDDGMRRAAAEQDEDRYAAIAELAGDRITVVTVPLVATGQVVGLVTVVGQAGRTYDDAELDLAAELGQRIATMLAAERLADRQRASHEITVALSAAGTVAEASAELAAGLRAALGAAVVTVCTVGRDGLLHVEHVAGHPTALPGSFAPMPLGAPLPLTEAVRTRLPVWLTDRGAWEERYPEVGAGLLGATEAGAVLPLLVGGRVLGTVGLTFLRPREFDQAERTFLLALAGQAAVAFERAALADTRQEIADTLQHSLLPRGLPALDGLTATARYLPGQRGTQAGGDWYDVLPLPDGRVAIAVGDVVGNGAAAAAVMGQLRSALATLLLEGHAPAQALDLLDRFATQVEGARVSTAACLLLDPVSGRLVYSRAGHPPPLVLDDDGPRFLDGGLGAALDLAVGGRRGDAETVLRPGATLLLYTDGLVERRGATLDTGLERLAATAAELTGEDPAALVDALLGRLLDGGPVDDVAVVAARLSPARLELTIPARPEQLRILRRDVQRWASGSGLSAEVVDDVLLAVGEAAANAVEHAYPDGATGTVAVVLERDGGGVTGTVHDTGIWRPPPADPGFRGRGLQILRALADDVDVRSVAEGTTVRFRLPLPSGPRIPPQPAPPEVEAAGARLELADSDGGSHVRVTGDLDLAGVTSVREPLLAAVLGRGPVVLDLTGVAALSSVGLGLLVEAVTAAGGPGALEVLLPATGAARRAVELTGLGPLLHPGG